MSDRFRNALQGAWKRVEERQWIYGSVGRLNPDTTYTYEVPGRKNFIYVTVRVAGGAQTAVPARNDARVPLVPKLAVKMKLEYGTYVIHGKTGRQEYGVSDAALDLDGTLLGLDDTPDSYVGQGGKVIAVNIAEDAVEFIPAPGGAVDSVNGQTGVVNLDTDDIPQGAINLYFTAAEETKLAGIAEGAEVNVNADWAAVSGDAMILNKPALVEAFLDLSDVTPVAYTGASGKVVAVNATEDGLEFITPAAASGAVLRDGSLPLTANWDIGDTLRILADGIRARDTDGVRIENAAGALGLLVEDSGRVTVGSGLGDMSFKIDGGAGFVRQLAFRSGGSNRWIWTATAAAESGSNVGSDLQLWARDDAGLSVNSNVIHFQRATGWVGVNTPTPNERFEVHDGEAATSVGQFLVDTANQVVYVGRLNSAGGSTRFVVRNRVGTTFLEVDPTGGNTYLNPSAGNVGIATTDIEAWSSAYRGIQLGPYAALMFGATPRNFYMLENAYFDGAWKRRTASSASEIRVGSGGITFAVTETGAADSALVWTTAMEITNEANVGIGTITPGENIAGTFDYGPTVKVLQVDGSTSRIVIRGSLTAALDLIDSAGAANDKWMQLRVDGGITKFISISDTGSTQVDNIIHMDHSTGDVGIGKVASSGFKLDVDGDIRSSGVVNVGNGLVAAGSFLVDHSTFAHIRQPSTTAAVPVMQLTQNDVSEEFIQFSSGVGAGNPIDTAALGTYYGKVRVSVNGTFKYMALYNS